MTEMLLDISVIICAYTEKRWDDLMAAVDSVRQQIVPVREIIVVIDHNAELLRRAQEALPDVVVVENTGTPGTSEAWNSGIAFASGQAIAFLDDDVVAKPDWSLSLQEPLKNPHMLGIGGSVTPNWSEKRPSWFPEEFYWVVGCTYRGMPQTAATIRNPIGSNMVFRREVFEGIGVFRRELGSVGASLMRCDETELCIRAHQRWPQGSFLYEPEANVSHRVPAGRATWRYFCARCYAEGLSKAVMTRFVGVKDGLSAERVYVLKTLPQGIIRGAADMLLHHNISGIARSGAIIAGFVVTVAGYLAGRLSLTVKFYKKDQTPDVALTGKST